MQEYLFLVNFYVNLCRVVSDFREFLFYKKQFLRFYTELPNSVQKKYDYVFVTIMQAEQIPIKFFKKLKDSNNLYEIRVESQSNIYRTFCCFDGNNLVILFNSFQKKSQKTPKKELQKADKLKKEYFDGKEKN